MNKKFLIIVIIALLAVAGTCLAYYSMEYRSAQGEIAEYTDVQQNYSETLYSGFSGQAQEKQSETDGLPYVVADFDALRAINHETVGWVAIPDSLISYPVMQTTNNKKYLDYSSNGTESSAGAAFMDCKNTLEPLDTNTIIYGHNMGHGRTDMFGTLLLYSEKEYYDAHKYIQFDTYQHNYGWWKIFAVINHDIKSGDFNYLRLSFSDEKEFTEWIQAAKDLSLYDTGVEVKPSDKVLTLSTCDRTDYGKNGRQLVLAVWMGEPTPKGA